MADLKKPNTDKYEDLLRRKKIEKPFMLTPYIVTFCEGILTDIDMQNLLELGLRVIRFNISHIVKSDKVLLLSTFKKAIASCCEKHETTSWPVAISIDLPNACILTGYLKEEIKQAQVNLQTNHFVEVTSDRQYWNKCDEKRIFIDDPFTFPSFRPGTEISINFGAIVMICTEVVSKFCIKCKIKLGGLLESAQFVCVRGVRHKRPSLSKLDQQLLEFVRENELDVINIHSIRNPEAVAKVRAFFGRDSKQPFVLCTICEQEGLDNVDGIIEAADGVVLAREFLAHAIIHPNRMTAIQMYISGKCRQLNKPFYISGILLDTLKHGKSTYKEISDVANAMMQGAGFLMRSYLHATNVLTAVEILNDLGKVTETLHVKRDFWRLCMERQPPVNAADATILGCAVAAKQTGTSVVVVLTATGKTATRLACLLPETVVLAVTTNAAVARRMQMYRGIIPIVYEKSGVKDFHVDMDMRTTFAVKYGLKNDLLCYNQTYIVLRKATSSSAFCDQVSSWKVMSQESKQRWIVCPETSQSVFDKNYLHLPRHV